jgi:hypothetical protein
MAADVLLELDITLLVELMIKVRVGIIMSQHVRKRGSTRDLHRQLCSAHENIDVVFSFVITAGV